LTRSCCSRRRCWHALRERGNGGGNGIKRDGRSKTRDAAIAAPSGKHFGEHGDTSGGRPVARHRELGVPHILNRMIGLPTAGSPRPTALAYDHG
jgi:hypothetical protein